MEHNHWINVRNVVNVDNVVNRRWAWCYWELCTLTPVNHGHLGFPTLSTLTTFLPLPTLIYWFYSSGQPDTYQNQCNRKVANPIVIFNTSLGAFGHNRSANHG